MTDNLKKTYFELKDETGQTGKKKQKKVQVENKDLTVSERPVSVSLSFFL